MVPAADVDAEGHAAVPLDDRVVELDARVEHLVRVAAALPVPFANRFIQQRVVLWRVDLDVLTSESLQFLDLASCEVDEIREVGVTGGIRGPRLIRVVIRGCLLRAYERDLHRLLCAATKIRKLFNAHLSPPAKLL